ncbi:MAG TPA: hypothetical protein VIH10_06805, partial [Kribbella sp.]
SPRTGCAPLISTKLGRTEDGPEALPVGPAGLLLGLAALLLGVGGDDFDAGAGAVDPVSQADTTSTAPATAPARRRGSLTT